MTIHIRYFAALRDSLGRAEDILPFCPGITAAEIWAHANPGTPWPPAMLVAINQEYAQGSSAVADGDEVAFFPPVTGG